MKDNSHSRRPVPERIAHFTKPGERGCLLWTGVRDKDGYGKMTINKKRNGVTRVVWELAHGPIPPGLFVLHKCDNPPCINVEHLFLGNNLDNVRDCRAKGRDSRGSAHYAAKLTEEDVRGIRASSLPRLEIARRYGVSIHSVVRIRAMRSWKHVV